MSATISSRHVGMVLMAFQISFASASDLAVPTKCSLPSFSCALPSNLPLAVWMAHAYVSLKPILTSRFFRPGASDIPDGEFLSRASTCRLRDDGEAVTLGTD